MKFTKTNKQTKKPPLVWVELWSSGSEVRCVNDGVTWVRIDNGIFNQYKDIRVHNIFHLVRWLTLQNIVIESAMLLFSRY